MSEMLQLYFPNLIAGVLAGVVLSLWGCQLAARDRSMHTLCMSQGAMFGALVGIILFGVEFQAGAYVTSLLFAVMVGLFSEWMTRSVSASVNTYFVAFFIIILAANHVLGGLFPAVSSHLTQIFFGDLVTVSSSQAWVSVGLSSFMLSLLLMFKRKISNRSFERFAFPEEAIWLESVHTSRRLFWVEAGVFLYLCYMIQVFGFLFAVGALFAPTVFLSLGKKPKPRLNMHLALAGLIMGLAVLLGLPLTLVYDKLPTVPTILLIAMGLAWLL